MADLVTTTPSQNGTSASQGQMTKSSRGKNKASLTQAQPKGVFDNIEKIDSFLGSGFSEQVLQMIVAKQSELQSIASESMQMEYMLEMAGEKAKQEGAKLGRQKAEQEIRAKRIEVLRGEAEKFMASFGDFFNGLIAIGMSFDEAKKQITAAAHQHYVKVDIQKVGDDLEWDWEFTLNAEDKE